METLTNTLPVWKIAQNQSIEFIKSQLISFTESTYLDLYILEAFGKSSPCSNLLDKHLLYVWQGRRKNPSVRLYSDNAERLKEIVNTRKKIALDRKKRKDAKKGFIPSFEEGDIFVASWGYGQTNVNCYQVVSKASKHYAILREIAYTQIEGSEGHDCCNVKPVKDTFLADSLEIRRKVGEWGIKISDVKSASKWDGVRVFYRSWYY